MTSNSHLRLDLIWHECPIRIRTGLDELFRVSVPRISAYKDNPDQSLREVLGRCLYYASSGEGFKEAVGSETNIVGVKIQSAVSFKLFRKTEPAALRGMAYIRHEKSVHLDTWRRT